MNYPRYFIILPHSYSIYDNSLFHTVKSACYKREIINSIFVRKTKFNFWYDRKMFKKFIHEIFEFENLILETDCN